MQDLAQTDGDWAATLDELVRILIARGWMLATAESCTGGWVAKVCTDRAGSSTWFERGYVTYSDRAKQELLGVTPVALEQHGAVSEAVVRQMADGARARAGVAVALAITGIAGPGGGSPAKPPGSVWFGWCCGEWPTRTRLHCLAGNRDAVRRQSVGVALHGLLRLVAG